MFLETICINKGIILNIEAHLSRMQHSSKSCGMEAPHLPNLISMIPKEMADKKVRCSITYGSIISGIVFVDYKPRKINSLKLIGSDIDYSLKFANRDSLNELLSQKGDSDEVLIVKNNCITDTTFSNVVFKNNDGLFTPDTYLLNGTKRQSLLKCGMVVETRITTDDLHKYDSIFLINAMLDIGDIEIYHIDLK